MRTHAVSLMGAILVSAASAWAQSNVATGSKHAWNEGEGWLNCRDANGGLQGARLRALSLSGFIWSEGAGWIRLGAGDDGCGRYPPAASQTGSAYGVNLTRDAGDPSRLLLSGYGWSERSGWVNFGGGALATPPQPAFIQTGGPTEISGRLRGYAWSEGSGWLNFDVASPGQFVSFCYSDCDGSGFLTANDYVCFLNAYAAGDAYANCDASTGSPCLTANDFVCFITQITIGCS